MPRRRRGVMQVLLAELEQRLQAVTACKKGAATEKAKAVHSCRTRELVRLVLDATGQ